MCVCVCDEEFILRLRKELPPGDLKRMSYNGALRSRFHIL